jgi:rare lipoprotein A
MSGSWNVGRRARLVVAMTAGLSLAACASIQPRYPNQGSAAQPAVAGTGAYKVGKPYQVGGVWYVPREQPDYDVTGVASWYGDAFHQKATANGELFDMFAVTGAHTTLPLPSMVEVTNLDNGRKLTVRVNDRGPFVGDRIIDLSREAARQLGYERAGLARVRVRYVGPAPLLGRDAGVRYAGSPAPAPAPAGRPRAQMATLAAAASDPFDAPIESRSLPPLTPTAAPAAPTVVAAPESAPTVVASAPSSNLRIQAGAFSTSDGAQRAVSQLAPAGQVLYRVMLPAPPDESAAYALRDRVAQIGFTDARVVRAF